MHTLIECKVSMLKVTQFEREEEEKTNNCRDGKLYQNNKYWCIIITPVTLDAALQAVPRITLWASQITHAVLFFEARIITALDTQYFRCTAFPHWQTSKCWYAAAIMFKNVILRFIGNLMHQVYCSRRKFAKFAFESVFFILYTSTYNKIH